MAERIGASEAKAHFSELLARTGYSGERFIVERRGKPVAALVGVEDLKKLEEGGVSRPRGAAALVGAWREVVDDPEIEDMISSVYERREAEFGRDVELGDAPD